MIFEKFNKGYLFREFLNSILHSYSQVFFSNQIAYAIILLIVSFFDFYAGLSGLFSVIVTNVFAFTLGFNKTSIKNGIYGLNSLLVGLGIGLYFQPGIELFTIVMVMSIFTFFISVVVEGILQKYGLPILSISFLIGIWVVSLANSEFRALGLSERGLFSTNQMYILGGKFLVDIFNWWNHLEIITSLRIYFLSLGAIFFQNNVFAGIIISIGLLINSRISFTLSLLGFYIAYLFYQLIGADILSLSYTYIGFNFILTSIALGGFYVIPGRYSYLWMIALLPIVVLLTISTDKIFSQFYLSIYSLPFNIVSLLFLFALKLRVTKGQGLVEVLIQHNSPEKNLYYTRNANERFNEKRFFPIFFPFWGEWKVSQAHSGEYTHKDSWQHAWDFVIVDGKNKEYRNNGNNIEDYFCYGKKVIAVADGVVQEIVDGIQDNKIGEFNTLQNWGNTIVIKHNEYLFSQISHLKPGSFKVAKGEVVKKGDILALCGNSGRSPYPHLHFQLQLTPYVGSETIDYPISQYIRRKNNSFLLKSFSKPEKGDLVSNIQSNDLLIKAFKFIPGQKFHFKQQSTDYVKEANWIVGVDFYSNTYLYCEKSKSYAYFYNDGYIHYFKSFTGDKKSLLYQFYLAAYKIQTGYYKKMAFIDNIPINNTFKGTLLYLQDFIAPFFIFLQSNFIFNHAEIDNEITPSEIKISTSISNCIFNKKLNDLSFQIGVDNNGIKNIIINSVDNKQQKEWIRV